jgi:hypothetical protein
MPTKIHDGDLNSDGGGGDESESGKSTKSTRSSSRKSTASGSTAKTPRKPSSRAGPASTRKASSGAKTPASKSVSRSSSRSALKEVVEDEETEEEQAEPVETKPKGKKASTAKTPAKSTKVKKTATARGRSRSVAPSESEAELVTEDDEVEPPATIKKKPASKSKASAPTPAPSKKPKARSNSVARRVAPEAPSDIEAEQEDEAEPPKPVTKSKSKVSKKAPTSAPVHVESNDEVGSDMDLDEAWTTAPETERKTSKSGGSTNPTKSLKKAPESKGSKQAEEQTEEDEHIQKTVKKPVSKSKPRTTVKAKPPSKSRSKAAEEVFESEIDTEAEPDPAPVKRASRSTTTKPPSKAQSSDKGKGKAVSTKPSVTQKAEETQDESEAGTDLDQGKAEEDEFGPIIRQPSFSANGQAKGKPSSVAGASRPPKQSPPVMMKNQDGDEDVEMTPVFVPKRGTPAAPPVAREASTGPSKLPAPKADKQKKQIKVVDVSSDEDEEDEKLVEEQVQVMPTPHKPPIQRSVKLVQKKPLEDCDDVVMNLDPIEPSTDIDNSMHEDGAEEHHDTQPALEPPRTPLAQARHPSPFPPVQASFSSSQLAHGSSQGPDPRPGQDETEEPPFFPPLSRMPFMPLPTLTPAELDMTVEEWVRYQMEMEYDKFKRDGERELVRFRNRAEDVRKIIDGL